MTRVPSEELRARYRLPDGDEDLLAECEVTAFQSGGPGGQHKNRTLSAIRLHHRPSGLVVIGRRERSQRRNLEDALGRLRQRLRDALTPPRKRKPTRPTRASQEKRMEEKRRQAERKRDRGRPDLDG